MVGYVLRSPYAHAKFAFGDLGSARAMKGVKLILTHQDVAGIGDLPCQGRVKQTDGSDIISTSYPVLPKDEVKHIDEAVVFIVAETLEHARDAAEAIAITYDALPVAGDIAAALAPRAPLVHSECPGNIAFETILGDKPKRMRFLHPRRALSR